MPDCKDFAEAYSLVKMLEMMAPEEDTGLRCRACGRTIGSLKDLEAHIDLHYACYFFLVEMLYYGLRGVDFSGYRQALRRIAYDAAVLHLGHTIQYDHILYRLFVLLSDLELMATVLDQPQTISAVLERLRRCRLPTLRCLVAVSLISDPLADGAFNGLREAILEETSQAIQILEERLSAIKDTVRLASPPSFPVPPPEWGDRVSEQIVCSLLATIPDCKYTDRHVRLRYQGDCIYLMWVSIPEAIKVLPDGSYRTVMVQLADVAKTHSVKLDYPHTRGYKVMRCGTSPPDTL